MTRILILAALLALSEQAHARFGLNIITGSVGIDVKRPPPTGGCGCSTEPTQPPRPK